MEQIQHDKFLAKTLYVAQINNELPSVSPCRSTSVTRCVACGGDTRGGPSLKDIAMTLRLLPRLMRMITSGAGVLTVGRLGRADSRPDDPVVRLVVDYGDGVEKHFTQLNWIGGRDGLRHAASGVATSAGDPISASRQGRDRAGDADRRRDQRGWCRERAATGFIA